MERMTKGMVDQAFNWLIECIRENGGNVDNVVIIHGSVTYGRQWYLAERDPKTFGIGKTIQLGSNLRESYNSLRAMTNVIDKFNLVAVPF